MFDARLRCIDYCEEKAPQQLRYPGIERLDVTVQIMHLIQQVKSGETATAAKL